MLENLQQVHSMYWYNAFESDDDSSSDYEELLDEYVQPTTVEDFERTLQMYHEIHQSIGHVTYAGKTRSKNFFTAGMLVTLIEVYRDQITHAPHILLHGAANSGKSLFLEMLFDEDVTKISYSDDLSFSSDDFHPDEPKAVVFDDCTENFWESVSRNDIILSHHHNSIGIGSERLPAMAYIIESCSIDRFSTTFNELFAQDVIEERFLTAEFTKTDLADTEEFVFNDKIRLQLLFHLIETFIFPDYETDDDAATEIYDALRVIQSWYHEHKDELHKLY